MDTWMRKPWVSKSPILVSESMEKNRLLYRLNMNTIMECITSQKYVFLSVDSRGKLYD